MRNYLLSNVTGKDFMFLYTFNFDLTIKQAVCYFRNFVKRRMAEELKKFFWVCEVGEKQRERFENEGLYRPHFHVVHFGVDLKWGSEEELHLIDDL